ncbi:MAG: DUF2726 domain-containing protein [Chloroflexi bacterium]|uniref:DUF2726 domain-containing protein n=1 Tax=Candidatus Flexifilum breve TaxID=3140694 RepID=UPI003137326B|nr:DUF2726 domain-containing protein [Chloroflexota bacterium]
MSSDKKFGMLRGVLRAIGLSPESADQVVDFIVDLLAGEGKGESAAASASEFPYHLRDHFLSAAELSFHGVLRVAIDDRAVILNKVRLSDVFYVKRGDDASKYRIYTNKIDRKHVDFLLCDPRTMQPLLGIELDDKSHQREDRQTRDAFVDGVFAAADLPLIHVPAKRAYVPADVEALFAPYVAAANELAARPPFKVPAVVKLSVTGEPCCPKCGSAMILRTSKSGGTAGTQFWGCSNFPKCRGMVPYQA